MFSENLKQLIEASLVDGVLMPNERAIILKRAMLEGIDADEANLLLDAEVQKIKIQKQAKEPKLHKCPACGEILPALTAICPSCGTAIENNEEPKQHELDFLIEQMNRGLSQLKCGTTVAPMVIAALDEHRRRAMMLYGDNAKIKKLGSEIEEAIDKYKSEEAKRQEEEKELKRMETLARIEAAKSRGGLSNLTLNLGCMKGCLISMAIIIALGIFGGIMGKDDNEKADDQYAELVGRLDSLKAEPLTIENYARKEAIAIDLIWVENNEYSSYEKRKKEAFNKLLDNYIDQLSTFYALKHTEIDNYNGYVLHNLDEAEQEEQQQNNVTKE